ncbi:cell wall-binding repeat-containing protein [Clostridium sp. DJ247]|uniref:cell wall-binding repeat-containing protein n=1 Tax=Clostridium sp. DJ247 TaxID=2726188 RepID=UPI00162387C6|nr:cell wall-binding repeat-containing protein [Clostridium sp. DJ247]MBC2579495.1 cell wall-binding repeat-containing protein [Clostridium sp. DJ247]
MKIKKLVALCALLAIMGSSSIVSADGNVTPASERLSGTNRYETSANISKSGWKEGSDYVVIANGAVFADALCSVPLAKKYNAPVILTESNKLSDAAKAEIERLKVKHVVIVGGNAVVTDEVANAISNSLSVKPEVKRIWGKDRFETSAKVAEELGNSESVFITYGYNYADALSISSIAGIKGMPILLTDKDALPDSVSKFMSEGKTSNAYIIGLQGVIGSNVESSINNIAAQPSIRLGGSDRYETNVAVLKQFDSDIKYDNIFLAAGDGPTGDEFADALSGSALAAQKGAPLLLTYKTLPKAIANYIKDKVKSTTASIGLGGQSVLPDNVVESVKNYVADKQDTQKPTNPGNSSRGGGGGSTVDTTKTYGTNPLIQVKGSKVTITYTDADVQDTDITIKINLQNTSTYKYINQLKFTNGTGKFETTLDSGNYEGEIYLNGNKIQLSQFSVN